MHLNRNFVQMRVFLILHFFYSTLNLFGKVLKYLDLIKIFGEHLLVKGNGGLEGYFGEDFVVLDWVEFDGYFVEVGVGKGFDFGWDFFYVMRKLFSTPKGTKILGNLRCDVEEIGE